MNVECSPHERSDMRDGGRRVDPGYRCAHPGFCNAPRRAAMYKPFRLIGLELSISALNVALRGEPTGSAKAWRGDAVTVARRALKAGEMLDGEGGYTVYAKLIPAARRLALGALAGGLLRPGKPTTGSCRAVHPIATCRSILCLSQRVHSKSEGRLFPKNAPALQPMTRR